MNRRVPVVLLVIISLILSGATRRWSQAARASGRQSVVSGGQTGLSRMNSFALALLLGGLRGPLVIMLWPSAEVQKNERNLEDFDTKIEWIRLLQAEFDSVHVYQIWNKAYNISVQMANLSNKYTTILDALQYGYSVDQERPDDINIVFAIGQLFAEKLGTSFEKGYYRQRVRDESLARQPQVRMTAPTAVRGRIVQAAAATGWPPSKLNFSTDETADTVAVTVPKSLADRIRAEITDAAVTYTDRPIEVSKPDDPQWRRRALDPMLDENNRILPALLAPRNPRPSDLPADSDWEDGSELQYLAAFQPYPYGISSMALGYNYYKRAQVLMTVNRQKHLQLSEVVIDSRPAVMLRDWADDEWEQARRAEAEALGTDPSVQRMNLEMSTAGLPLDTRVLFHSRFDQALFGYGRALEISQLAHKEYARHLAHFKNNLGLYLQHDVELTAKEQLIDADRAYLEAMLATGAKRKELAAAAAEKYQTAIRGLHWSGLYNITTELLAEVAPPGLTKARLAVTDAQVLAQVYQSAAAAVANGKGGESDKDTLPEYEVYLSRCQARLQQLPH